MHKRRNKEMKKITNGELEKWRNGEIKKGVLNGEMGDHLNATHGSRYI